MLQQDTQIHKVLMIHTLALQAMTEFYYFSPNLFQIVTCSPNDHSEITVTLKHMWESETFRVGEQMKIKKEPFNFCEASLKPLLSASLSVMFQQMRSWPGRERYDNNWLFLKFLFTWHPGIFLRFYLFDIPVLII